MNESLNNRPNEQVHNYTPQAPAHTEPRFDNYTEKTGHFFEIEKQIEDKKSELAFVAKQSMENPTASKEAYVRLMGVIKDDIEELKLKKEGMMHSKKTIH